MASISIYDGRFKEGPKREQLKVGSIVTGCTGIWIDTKPSHPYKYKDGQLYTYLCCEMFFADSSRASHKFLSIIDGKKASGLRVHKRLVDLLAAPFPGGYEVPSGRYLFKFQHLDGNMCRQIMDAAMHQNGQVDQTWIAPMMSLLDKLSSVYQKSRRTKKNYIGKRKINSDIEDDAQYISGRTSGFGGEYKSPWHFANRDTTVKAWPNTPVEPASTAIIPDELHIIHDLSRKFEDDLTHLIQPPGAVLIAQRSQGGNIVLTVTCGEDVEIHTFGFGDYGSIPAYLESVGFDTLSTTWLSGKVHTYNKLLDTFRAKANAKHAANKRAIEKVNGLKANTPRKERQDVNENVSRRPTQKDYWGSTTSVSDEMLKNMIFGSAPSQNAIFDAALKAPDAPKPVIRSYDESVKEDNID